jgi:hypothetical protein
VKLFSVFAFSKFLFLSSFEVSTTVIVCEIRALIVICKKHVLYIVLHKWFMKKNC